MQQNQPHGATKMPTRDERENKPYIHQPYPSCRFHPDGSVREVANEAADKELGQPWRSRPYPPPPPVAVVAEPTVAEMKATVAALTEENSKLVKANAKLAQITVDQTALITMLKKKQGSAAQKTAEPKTPTPAAEPKPAEPKPEEPKE